MCSVKCTDTEKTHFKGITNPLFQAFLGTILQGRARALSKFLHITWERNEVKKNSKGYRAKKVLSIIMQIALLLVPIQHIAYADDIQSTDNQVSEGLNGGLDTSALNAYSAVKESLDGYAVNIINIGTTVGNVADRTKSAVDVLGGQISAN